MGHSTCPDKIDFPIKEDFADKRSYITPTVAWARNEFIQTDLTKLFQKARRLPGKGMNRDSERVVCLDIKTVCSILYQTDKQCFIVN